MLLKTNYDEKFHLKYIKFLGMFFYKKTYYVIK